MTQEEYKSELAILQKEFESKRFSLAKKYCESNNPYKTGDIITDHIGSIILESMSVSSLNGLPTLVYFGVELKKDLTPNKKGNKRQLWQPNIKTI